MAKPKTLRERAGDYARSLKAMTVAWRDGAEEGYIAGHRAGSRLTKAERDILESAFEWWRSKRGPNDTRASQIKNPTCNCNGPWEDDLAKKVAAYEAKKVRK